MYSMAVLNEGKGSKNEYAIFLESSLAMKRDKVLRLLKESNSRKMIIY